MAGSTHPETVTVRLARNAMACRFELVLQGENEPWLRAAGEEALREIERLEARLSIFRSDSDVSRINATAARRPVVVEPRLFQFLEQLVRLYRQTDFAFDVTVGPLMEAWGFYGGAGALPDPAELEAARLRTGMHLVELDKTARTVRFAREGVRIDLGAVGKGYAIDEAVTLLREAGVEHAFLHGGTSTMYGIGRPIDGPAWNVAVPHPGQGDEPAAVVPLVDEGMSVSAVWGKAFEDSGVLYGHVLDPRLGRPVRGALLAAAVGPSATDTDALSTALLVRGRPIPSPGIRSMVILRDGERRPSILTDGMASAELGSVPGDGPRRIEPDRALRSR